MVDYNNFAKEFAKSRKNMKWEEIDYFLESPHLTSPQGRGISILDIWCWSWRLLEQFLSSPLAPLLRGKGNYTWIDLSSWLLEEAKNSFPEKEFLELNMLNIDKIPKLSPFLKGSTWNVMEGEGLLFNNIFFIASFHHLDNLKDREEVLDKAYNLLEEWWRIYMTNWALNSKINNEKYKNSKLPHPNPLLTREGIEMNFWSTDYNIVFWKNNRYYHCFDLYELEYLAKNAWFKIIENRLFDTEKNFITILEK